MPSLKLEASGSGRIGNFPTMRYFRGVTLVAGHESGPMDQAEKFDGQLSQGHLGGGRMGDPNDAGVRGQMGLEVSEKLFKPPPNSITNHGGAAIFRDDERDHGRRLTRHPIAGKGWRAGTQSLPLQLKKIRPSAENPRARKGMIRLRCGVQTGAPCPLASSASVLWRDDGREWRDRFSCGSGRGIRTAVYAAGGRDDRWVS